MLKTEKVTEMEDLNEVELDLVSGSLFLCVHSTSVTPDAVPVVATTHGLLQAHDQTNGLIFIGFSPNPLC